MTKLKGTLVSRIKADLDWLKDRAEEIKREAERLAYDEIEDRIVTLMGATGPADKVAATKEAIQKSRREALKDYAEIIAMIEKLEETEAAKVEARGGQKLSSRAARFAAGD